MSTVEIKNLKKNYKDRKSGLIEAVKGISFNCEKGEVFGLLGPNGAGKTTLLRMLSTIITPTEGTASVAGFDIIKEPLQVRASIGFLTGNTGLYGRLTAYEMLTYIGSLYDMDKKTLAARCEEISGVLDMGSFLHRKCDKLSTGQKQRVSIARTIIHNPEVLLLDEPTLGLDVMTGRTIISFIQNAKSSGKCIILCSHQMDIVEKLADQIALIHLGKIIASGTLEELKTRTGETYLDEIFLNLIDQEETKEIIPLET